jgi:hypothetical protein
MSQSTKPQKPALPVRSDGQPVPPAVKAWLDNVIVPALVKQWMAERSKVTVLNFSEESNGAESETAKLR